MCILFIYSHPEPEKEGYRLIIASNRDEFFKRPAQVAYRCEKTGIIGGRDMEKGREGGMWLGISTNDRNEFRFGALLNVTGETRNSPASGRGVIVKDYLTGSETSALYIDSLLNSKEPYNAYNFVAVEIRDYKTKIYQSSNSPISQTDFEGKQILGFGNSTIANPLKKVVNGKQRFEGIINKYNNSSTEKELIEELVQLLKWQEKHIPDEELQRRAPDLFEKLSSVYVSFIDASYGTRTHSVILIDYDWNVEFVELTMAEPIDQNSIRWEKNNIKAHL